jgi:hypothetical protein
MKHTLAVTSLMLASLAAVGQTIYPKKCMEEAQALLPDRIDITQGRAALSTATRGDSPAPSPSAREVTPDSPKYFSFVVQYSQVGTCYLRIDDSSPGTIRTMVFGLVPIQPPMLLASFLAQYDLSDQTRLLELKKCQVASLDEVKQCHSRDEFEHLVESSKQVVETGLGLAGKP